MPVLAKGIAGFYDRLTDLWESVWGEHLHHGYYPEGRGRGIDHKAAQVEMIRRALAYADAPEAVATAVDVGCGIGGSARYLASTLGAKATGITLSPWQAARANALSADGTASAPGASSFQVADALDMPFADGAFELVWSMEAGEHMPDKKQFVDEMARVAKPGGKVIVVAWTHRDLLPGETELPARDRRLLDRISDRYFLPPWCAESDYAGHFAGAGLEGFKSEDWSEYVAPFWPAVVRSALNPINLVRLLRKGRTGVRAGLAMRLMMKGYKRGLIKFTIATGTKPGAAASGGEVFSQLFDKATKVAAAPEAAAAAAAPKAAAAATPPPAEEAPDNKAALKPVVVVPDSEVETAAPAEVEAEVEAPAAQAPVPAPAPAKAPVPAVETSVSPAVAQMRALEAEARQENTDNDDGDEGGPMAKIKEFGLAGTLSFILWEWAFWLIGGGGAVAAYVQATGHLPDLSNKDELAATGGSAFAFINVARLAVPVRIGLAVSTAPWVEENVVMKFGLKGNDDETDG